MNKRILILFLIFILLAAGCASKEDPRITELEQEVAALQTRIAELEAENAELNAMLFGGISADDPEGQPMAEMLLYGWSQESGKLTIDDAFVRVYSLTGGIAGSTLTLCLNDTLLSEASVELYAGEADDSMEGVIENLTFDLPALNEGDILTLLFEVTLPSGQVLTAWGADWISENGMLQMIAG